MTQQENAHMMERLDQFEIIEAKLRDEMMTTQSENNDILVKVKWLQKKIALITTYIKVMKAVNKQLEKYNELLAESRNTKPSLMKLSATIIMKYY